MLANRTIRLDSADPTGGGARVERFDRGELRAPTRTDEGFLVADGLVAKPGVLTYHLADGTVRRELVTAAELRASLGTLRHKSLTLEHPAKFVTPETVRAVGVGSVGDDIRIDDQGGVVVKLVVRDAKALKAIDTQKIRELSPGYTVRLDFTPGVHPVFGAYDAVQHDRKYNHLALTAKARGGVDLRVRTDGAGYQSDAPRPESDPSQPRNTGNHRREDRMNPLILALITLGLTEDAAKTAAPSINSAVNASHRADSEAADEKVTAANTERDAALTERDALKVRLDSLGLDPADDAAWTDEAVHGRFIAAHQARTWLETLGTAHKVDSMDTLSDHALSCKILKAAKPGVDIDGKSEDWVSAAVSMLEARADSATSRADPWASFSRPTEERVDAAPVSRSFVHPSTARLNDAHTQRFGA